MISEKQLIGNYASFWRNITPASDLFVRRVNLELYERDLPPIAALTKPDRRGLINEVAFDLYCLRARPTLPVLREEQLRGQAVQAAFNRLQAGQAERGVEQDISDVEERDFTSQANAINLVITSRFADLPITLRPEFPGCGFLSPCRADILVGSTLIEVKAGERPFRSIDIRQLLTYCALNILSEKYEINRIGLINPRQGTSFFYDLETVCREVSGRGSYELLTEIVERLSSGGISR